MKNLIRSFSIFIVLLHQTIAWFEQCDYGPISVTPGQQPILQIYNRNYPKRYAAGSSCRYYLRAPPNYLIALDCNVDIEKTGPQCTSDFMYIALDGDRSLRNSEVICGRGNFQRRSSANELTFAYTSSSSSSGGAFLCKVTAIPQCDCGWSFSRKIVGGIEAGINEYPFMVGVMINNDIFCGGTIISSRWILSAAHCMKAKGIIGLKALVGDHDLKTHGETPFSAVYEIDYVRIHQYYYEDPDGDRNDIALLRTSRDIVFSEGVGPACLPFLYEFNLFKGNQVDIMGWGTTSFSGKTSTILLKATVKVQDNDNCRAEFPKLQDSQICTYAHEKDSCQYDSGGPVVYRNSRMFLVGIVSYGKVCGSRSPTMNTRITSYLNWIRTNTGANFCRKSY